ncbi:ABC transporter permease [Staphylococcus sp. EG-SA-6]|uniref:ABC transporter permease n=5 Tax=Staphylococcus haemolyticus TaxID=1283 RepID=A0A7Z1N2S0_STAHA|nr:MULTISPECIES: oligopeptide ABC transporter permease [Staphylococcus]MBN4935562.1 ABC transporter permease [Staphylococcus sp. EG-SA-6]MBC3104699.1 ABC transporter permease [Staphylococcus haemolyticus]MBD3928104.1 ABC transporter permease [Staphylococcus haemolyticus]MBK3923402.1 ABC transporter permease [Staphylococcus haemolyticus]MBK3937916.1 ABC transporter permease [Staphylococcus haemolyticus]
MIKLILKRFLLMIPLLFLISIVVFSLAIIQPGDPFSGQYNPHVKQEAIDAQREKLGLNDSIPTQYVRWIGNVAHGNLGESIKYKRPVMDLIIERMPNTILLGVVSLIITYILSFILGIISGRYAYSLGDYTIQVFNYVMLAIPSFIAGVFAIYIFAFQFPIFPFQGSVNINLQEGSFTYYLSKLYHTILPALTLGLLSTAGYIQYLRNDIIDNANKDYVLTAKAKGLTINKIYNKHILRNSLIPIITFLGADIVSILGGAVITETIFSFNGIGKLFLESVTGQDYPLMMALTLFFSFLGLFGNLISDITYNFVDPRIRSN